MRRQPNFIPLAEVSEHTDMVHVGELGLPVGLDLSQIELNVPALERTARWGNIGHVTIRGFRGDTTDTSYGIGGVSGDGSATMAATKVATRTALHGTDVSSPDVTPAGYDWKDATIKINNPEIEQKIRQDGDRWDLGLYDPRARAKYMNTAVRSGIMEAAKVSVAEDSSLYNTSVQIISMYAALSFLPNSQTVPSMVGAMGVQTGFNLEEHLRRRRNDQDGTLPNRQWSIFHSSFYDRLALSLVSAATSRFVRVAK